MTCDAHRKDLRRLGQIDTTREGDSIYRLSIKGVLWASVEWSPRRQVWCIEDGIGRCLIHVEHIHGQDRDPEQALRLAKSMIRSGTLPAPEEAHRLLREREEREALGEPIEEFVESEKVIK
jgi:hypothetical protein